MPGASQTTMFFVNAGSLHKHTNNMTTQQGHICLAFTILALRLCLFLQPHSVWRYFHWVLPPRLAGLSHSHSYTHAPHNAQPHMFATHKCMSSYTSSHTFHIHGAALRCRPQRKRGRSPPPPPSSQGQATNGSGSGCGQLTSSDRVEQGERAGSSRSVRLNGYQRSGMATARAGNGNASGPVSEDIDDDDDLSDGMRGGEGTGHTKGLDKDARSLRR